MIRTLVSTLVMSLALSFGAKAATEEQGPLFVKVFAGQSLNSRREFNTAVRKNLKAKIAIPDGTIIPCEIGKYYGLGVIVTAPGKQTFSFETTAIWRDLDDYDAPRRSQRDHTLRKNDFGTQRFFFKIRSGSVDHDMTFVAHIGNQVYLRHKFHIRGCDKPSSALLPQQDDPGN